MTAPIDFQHDENRWAAEMACEEANAVSGKLRYWFPHEASLGCPPLYALALRIARTEKKPVDPLLLRAREICAGQINGDVGEAYLSGVHDGNYIIRCVIAALKEGRGE